MALPLDRRATVPNSRGRILGGDAHRHAVFECLPERAEEVVPRPCRKRPAPDVELVSKLWRAYEDLSNPSVGWGHSEEDDYVIVMHPRRWAWLNAAGQNSQSIPPNLYGRIVQCGGIRSTLGGSTNEDEVFVLLGLTNHVRANAPRVRVLPEVLSGTLQVRVQAFQAVASAWVPPKSICRISGTGLVAASL